MGEVRHEPKLGPFGQESHGGAAVAGIGQDGNGVFYRRRALGVGVDGRLAGEFTGIRWRKDMDLKVNSLWLLHYGYDPGDPTKKYWKEMQTVWFDDIVVATRYIGPMAR